MEKKHETSYESPSAEVILFSSEPVTLVSTGHDLEVDFNDIF